MSFDLVDTTIATAGIEPTYHGAAFDVVQQTFERFDCVPKLTPQSARIIRPATEALSYALRLANRTDSELPKFNASPLIPRQLLHVVIRDGLPPAGDRTPLQTRAIAAAAYFLNSVLTSTAKSDAKAAPYVEANREWKQYLSETSGL